jgi:branched-chain amino acid transport system ATP-binding protein
VATHRRVALGATLVPEGRAIFAGLTVRENLDLGAFLRRDKQARAPGGAASTP